MLWGEAGIGKTALLERLVESVSGLKFLRGSGAESEMELAYASLSPGAVDTEMLRTANPTSPGRAEHRSCDRAALLLAVVAVLDLTRPANGCS